jgi:hypothetical protein
LKSYRRKKGRTWEETEEEAIWEGRVRCADIYATKSRSTSGSGVGSRRGGWQTKIRRTRGGQEQVG